MMHTNLTPTSDHLSDTMAGMLGTVYQYDQLNRLINADGYNVSFDEATGQWLSTTEASLYNNQFTYDANGNILTQQRSDHLGNQFEDLTYNNNTADDKIMQNRLYSVNEADIVHNALYTDDIEDQGAFELNNINDENNCGYTEIGELLRDDAEDIEQIVWRVDSKIAYIYRDNNSDKKELGFEYDAMGNRIAKHIYTATGLWEKSTYYVRDASGNVMATYEEKEEPENELSYMVIERHIYGSSRLGIDVEQLEMIGADPPTTDTDNRQLGLKQYELSNHLGNVLSVITDIKLPVVDGTTIIGYSAVIISATDYSPFGTVLEGRSWSSESYRYGFNGQERDDELYDLRNSYCFEYRVYDPRLGRFLSVDPLNNEYPWNSTYAFAENRVIDGMDLEGREWSSTTATDETTGATVVTLTVHIKVVNSSTVITDAQITELMAEVSKELTSTFTQTDATNNTSYVISMSYEIVPTANEVHDFAIELTDTAAPESNGLTKGGEATLGETQHQIIDIACPGNTHTEIASIANTVVHELGHSVGLEHPHQDKDIQVCANKYNSPEINNRENCPDVYRQYKACMDYLKSQNRDDVAPDMTILENFMMQSAAIDVLQEFYGNTNRSVIKSIDINSTNPSTGATIDQCKQAASTVEAQDPD